MRDRIIILSGAVIGKRIGIGRRTCLGLLGLSVLSGIIGSQALGPAWTAGLQTLSLPEISRRTMAGYFSGSPGFSSGGRAARPNESMYRPLLRNFRTSNRYSRPVGVFVTLSRDGKPRACWGSAFPQYKTVLEATVYATLGALTREYRYPPITPGEWRQLKTQVTVVRKLIPIHGLEGQNPLADGLMIRQGGRSGVILPGEARDAAYQLTLCRLKAGIRPGESFQLYRIITDVYR